jgi:hypothetical protein
MEDKIKHLACGKNLCILKFKNLEDKEMYLTGFRWCTVCQQLVMLGCSQRKVSTEMFFL